MSSFKRQPNFISNNISKRTQRSLTQEWFQQSQKVLDFDNNKNQKKQEDESFWQKETQKKRLSDVFNLQTERFVKNPARAEVPMKSGQINQQYNNKDNSSYLQILQKRMPVLPNQSQKNSLIVNNFQNQSQKGPEFNENLKFQEKISQKNLQQGFQSAQNVSNISNDKLFSIENKFQTQNLTKNLLALDQKNQENFSGQSQSQLNAKNLTQQDFQNKLIKLRNFNQEFQSQSSSNFQNENFNNINSNNNHNQYNKNLQKVQFQFQNIQNQNNIQENLPIFSKKYHNQIKKQNEIQNYLKIHENFADSQKLFLKNHFGNKKGDFQIDNSSYLQKQEQLQNQSQNSILNFHNPNNSQQIQQIQQINSSQNLQIKDKQSFFQMMQNQKINQNIENFVKSQEQIISNCKQKQNFKNTMQQAEELNLKADFFKENQEKQRYDLIKQKIFQQENLSQNSTKNFGNLVENIFSSIKQKIFNKQNENLGLPRNNQEEKTNLNFTSKNNLQPALQENFGGAIQGGNTGSTGNIYFKIFKNLQLQKNQENFIQQKQPNSEKTFQPVQNNIKIKNQNIPIKNYFEDPFLI